MRRPALLEYLTSWTGRRRASSSTVSPRLQGLIPRPYRAPSFTTIQLDRLGEILTSDGDTATAERQARFLGAVDRAIAEMAGPRERRKRSPFSATIRPDRGSSEAGGDRRGRSRSGPRRRPA